MYPGEKRVVSPTPVIRNHPSLTVPVKGPRANVDQEDEGHDIFDDLGCVLEGTRAEDAKQVC